MTIYFPDLFILYHLNFFLAHPHFPHPPQLPPAKQLIYSNGTGCVEESSSRFLWLGSDFSDSWAGCCVSFTSPKIDREMDERIGRKIVGVVICNCC